MNPYEVVDSELNSDEALICVICMQNNSTKYSTDLRTIT